jgi:8-oxo-dGTP diphosphatase
MAYKSTWEIPGGIAEEQESPYAACRREVAEELGLDRPIERILAIDWLPSRPELSEGLMLVYDGAVLFVRSRGQSVNGHSDLALAQRS